MYKERKIEKDKERERQTDRKTDRQTVGHIVRNLEAANQDVTKELMELVS